MRAALVNSSTNLVDNVIVADPAVDPAPEGFLLVALADDSTVSIGWIYNNDTFTDPNPPQPVTE